MHLSQIWTYPVKSCAGILLDKAVLDERGLTYDRHWMVVSKNGKMLTSREAPALIKVVPQFMGDYLVLTAPNMLFLELPYNSTGQELLVKVWEDEVEATLLPDASAWFTAYLGREVSLVVVAKDNTRTVRSHFGTHPLSFVDSSPLNLLGEASLGDLNSRLETPANIKQFRPNLVFTGGGPCAEDNWQSLRIGHVSFEVCGQCARCMVVNVKADGTFSKAPLATLATYRKAGKQVLFGLDLIHQNLGELSVGDKLEVLDYKS
jgi:uncharacterized protein